MTNEFYEVLNTILNRINIQNFLFCVDKNSFIFSPNIYSPVILNQLYDKSIGRIQNTADKTLSNIYKFIYSSSNKTIGDYFGIFEDASSVIYKIIRNQNITQEDIIQLNVNNDPHKYFYSSWMQIPDNSTYTSLNLIEITKPLVFFNVIKFSIYTNMLNDLSHNGKPLYIGVKNKHLSVSPTLDFDYFVFEIDGKFYVTDDMKYGDDAHKIFLSLDEKTILVEHVLYTEQRIREIIKILSIDKKYLSIKENFFYIYAILDSEKKIEPISGFIKYDENYQKQNINVHELEEQEILHIFKLKNPCVINIFHYDECCKFIHAFYVCEDISYVNDNIKINYEQLTKNIQRFCKKNNIRLNYKFHWNEEEYSYINNILPILVKNNMAE